MSRYKPYPEYKDSGVEWIGEVPAHWGVIAAKRLFSLYRRDRHDGSEQLAATQDYGVIPQSEYMDRVGNRVMQALGGLDGFKDVKKDFFVISLRSFEGGIERCHYNGCISPAYTVLKPASSVNPKFFERLLKSPLFIQSLNTVTTGIREGKTITYGQFGEIGLTLPPSYEQSQIATFLNRETTRIDTLIEKKQRFIELLEEKRQAVITHAVTKGLDPNVPMKDSGVEWIGEVPAHWEVKRVGRVFSVVAGHPFRSMLFATEGIPIVRMSNLLNGVVSHRCVRRIQREYVPDTAYAKAGDLLVGLSGSITNYALVNEDDLPCAVNQRVGILRGEKGIELMGYIATTSIFTDQISAATNEATIQNVSMEDVRSCRIPWPHNDERDDILRFLDRETTRIDTLIEKTRQSIELLKERRSALITAAVTGKIDVREEAA